MPRRCYPESRAELVWEKDDDLNCEAAMSGQRYVALYVELHARPGVYAWQVHGMGTLEGVELDGEAPSRAAARRAILRAWRHCLDLTGLDQKRAV